MRSVVMAFVTAALMAAIGQRIAAAEDFPTRPIKVIVGYAAGGPSDTGARLMADPLGRQLGQPIVIENQPGGGGLNSTESYARYPADGYTLLLGAIGPLTIIPAAEKVSYDPLHDFTPLGLVWSSPLTLVISRKLGVKTLKGFIAYAKANPGKVTFGSAGVGSVTHLAAALFMHKAGIQMTHIPYHSTSESLPALMGGQIDSLFGDTPILAPQIKSGQIVGIAIAAKKRAAVLPDVPTMAEAGQQNVEAASWFGFVASSKTPAPVIKRLQDAMSAAQKDPAYLAVLAKQSASFGAPGADAYGDIIKTDAAKWKTVIDEANIKLNQ
ncbi:MAG TPA: tripartite tricarboxylate transporter substrate binding protein [Xanthobacteraceae bacterium]